MKLPLKKYRATALTQLLPFVLLEAFIGLLFVTKAVGSGVFAVVTLANVFCLLLPGAYFLILFFLFKSKCKNVAPVDGVIANWSAGFYRHTGSVIVKQDEKEYSTSAYFSAEECKELVGKHVSYAIIDETLLIYEIKE